jgi:hypothetical protein
LRKNYERRFSVRITVNVFERRIQWASGVLCDIYTKHLLRTRFFKRRQTYVCPYLSLSQFWHI